MLGGIIVSSERKVTMIPATKKFLLRAAIYCRVSTRSAEQLDSLANQISYLTRLTSSTLSWNLVDIYIDVKTGSNTTGRNEFQRMMNDCQSGKIDVIVTKSISRFGRNTASTVQALNTLRGCKVDVYFENEELHSIDDKNTFLITIMEGLAQEENYNRSQNIRWGILRKVERGDAQILSRKCFGFYQNTDGNLEINQEEAKVVKQIFDMYLSGSSILGIIRTLESLGIISPSGNTKWCKRTIESILSNEKYTGNVIVFKTYNNGFPETKRIINEDKDKYIGIGCNPAIISEETFQKVQEERASRSNIMKTDQGVVRKNSHYSSKRIHTK